MVSGVIYSVYLWRHFSLVIMVQNQRAWEYSISRSNGMGTSFGYLLVMVLNETTFFIQWVDYESSHMVYLQLRNDIASAYIASMFSYIKFIKTAWFYREGNSYATVDFEGVFFTERKMFPFYFLIPILSIFKNSVEPMGIAIRIIITCSTIYIYFFLLWRRKVKRKKLLWVYL